MRDARTYDLLLCRSCGAFLQGDKGLREHCQVRHGTSYEASLERVADARNALVVFVRAEPPRAERRGSAEAPMGKTPTVQTTRAFLPVPSHKKTRARDGLLSRLAPGARRAPLRSARARRGHGLGPHEPHVRGRERLVRPALGRRRRLFGDVRVPGGRFARRPAARAGKGWPRRDPLGGAERAPGDVSVAGSHVRRLRGRTDTRRHDAVHVVRLGGGGAGRKQTHGNATSDDVVVVVDVH